MVDTQGEINEGNIEGMDPVLVIPMSALVPDESDPDFYPVIL